MTGVYRIRDVVDGSLYIGSALDIHRRRLSHFRALCQGQHHCPLLQRAYDAHGEAALLFEVVEECTPDKRLRREAVWMFRALRKRATLLNTALLRVGVGGKRAMELCREHNAWLAQQIAPLREMPPEHARAILGPALVDQPLAVYGTIKCPGCGWEVDRRALAKTGICPRCSAKRRRHPV
jgi:GIY-YIG catalytic domain